MATKKQYAEWCMKLIDGDDLVVDEIMEALIDDGFINDDSEWLTDEDEDE
jgi:hypothetical protein